MLKTKLVLSMVLVLCLISSLLPVSAAQIPLDDVIIPAEGISVTSGRNLWEKVTDGVAKDLLIILSSDDSKQFVNKSGTDHYVDLEASFTLTYDQASAPDGAPITFTVENCPVMHSRAAGSGELCLGFAPDDIIGCSPELSLLSDEGKSTKELLGTNQTQLPFFVSDMVIYKGYWRPEAIDVGAFSEGTVFLSHTSFLKYPSNWLKSSRGTNTVYDDILYPSVKYVLSNGPVQFFVAEATGTYNVWGQLFTNQSNTDRIAVITINGEEFKLDPTAVSTSQQTSALEPLWYTATDNKTVSLKKGDVVAVQITNKSGRYVNLATIALVPTADNAAVKAEIEKDRTVEHVTPAEVTVLMPPEAAQSFDAEYVDVTVNGVEVSTSAGTAAKKVVNSAGYISTTHSNQRVEGLPVFLRDNKVPSYVTAYDAVATYVLQTQTTSSHPYDIALLGGAFGNSILVNGEPVIGAWHAIKDGDVITITDRTNANFEPVSVGDNVLFSVIGGCDSSYAEIGGASKFCLSSANLANKMGSFSTKKDATGLKGTHLSGYVVVTSAGESSGLSTQSKIYFENAKFVDYNSSHGSSRIDMILSKIKNLNDAQSAFHTINDQVLYDSNGKAYHTPYGLVTRGAYYDFTNLYMTNSSVTGELNITNVGNTYTISTDSARLIDVLKVAYNEDGGVSAVEKYEDVMVMFNEPLQFNVSDNEKVFIWGTKALEGLNMVPLCEPILGANFLAE